MSENKSYRDPKRKVGSQSEVPMLIYTDDKIIVKGALDRSRDFVYINDLIRLTNRIENNPSCNGKKLNIWFMICLKKIMFLERELKS